MSIQSEDHFQLLEEHLPFIRRIAAFHLGQRLSELYEVDDVVQDAARGALEGMANVGFSDVSHFRAWLGTVVVNRVRGLGRRHRAAKRDGGPQCALHELDSKILRNSVFRAKGPTASQLVARDELDERIETAVSRLPEKQRQVFALRRVAGMGFTAIAQECGYSTAASARAAFAKALGSIARSIGIELGDLEQ